MTPTAGGAERTVARVLLSAPLPQLDRLLDYAIPEALAPRAVPGVRVRVPLRGQGRLVEGFLVELGTAVDPDRPLSELDQVLSDARVLPRALYDHARAVADRAAGSASDVLRLAVPRRQARIEAAFDPDAVEAAPLDDDARARAAETLGAFPGLADALAAGERLALDAPPVPGAASAATDAPAPGPTLGTWALVLAAAAAHVYGLGRSSVIAVPDHRDLDQLALALTGLVPPGAVVRHDSAQGPAARTRAYLRGLQPAPCIVIGNRSTVYAPVHEPGLVALWDDGDALFDEPLAPYAHARDAALVRQQQQQGTALLLAGHTRSSDAQRLVELGFVREIAPARRITPTIVLGAPAATDRPGERVSSAAFRAAREAIQTGPVLVQVARPGFAPTLVCNTCRQPARCRTCQGPLHARRRGAVPECRWCGRSAHGWACTHCEGRTFRLASSGSARTADELGRAFPGVRVIVSDGEHRVLRVEDRPALVVATRGAEPIAEGGYRAVVLLDGERMLMSESLRIGEDCLRWWSNAAALAAPGAPVHLVGVTGPVARALATWTQPAYAASQVRERAPLHLPPAARVARVEGTATRVAEAIDDVQEILGRDAVLGPVALAPTDADDPGVPLARALVRFDYARGAEVADALRASVVRAAVSGSRRPRGADRAGRPARARTTLRVRMDVPEPEL